jgi:RNA exonuclease 1
VVEGSAAMSAKKYKLHSSDGSLGPKICAFFLSDAGCRNGSSCKFSHGAAAASPAAVPTAIAAPAPAAASASRKRNIAAVPQSANRPAKRHAEQATPAQAAPKLPEAWSTPQPAQQPQGAAGALGWESLVERTKEYATFHEKYAPPTAAQQAKEGWTTLPPPTAAHAHMPSVIALDCEMCVTRNPDTGETDSASLLCLSIINGLNPEECLFHALVKPRWPVVDFKTRIHGISEEDVVSSASFEQVQAVMSRLCSSNTVIVGHSLYGDLKALKLVHNRVVDTSMLFCLGSGGMPALKDLVKFCLNKEMPQTHDSRLDARMALECAFSDVGRARGSGLKEVPRASGEVLHREAHHVLRVHRVPDNVTVADIESLFISSTYVVPLRLAPLCKKGSKHTTSIFFSTLQHADLAFETLHGKPNTDSFGNAQKTVFLPNKSAYIVVGKPPLRK